MTHLHITPMVSNIRVYAEPNGYPERKPYIAILTVLHLTDTKVYLMGAVGVVNRDTWRSAFELLRDMGILTALIERRGTLREISVTEQAAGKTAN